MVSHGKSASKLERMKHIRGTYEQFPYLMVSALHKLRRCSWWVVRKLDFHGGTGRLIEWLSMLKFQGFKCLPCFGKTFVMLKNLPTDSQDDVLHLAWHQCCKVECSRWRLAMQQGRWRLANLAAWSARSVESWCAATFVDFYFAGNSSWRMSKISQPTNLREAN